MTKGDMVIESNLASIEVGFYKLCPGVKNNFSTHCLTLCGAKKRYPDKISVIKRIRTILFNESFIK